MDTCLRVSDGKNSPSRKIAFFLRSPQFAGRWSLDEDAVPLSGTDGTMLFVVRTVRQSAQLQVVLLGSEAPLEGGVEFHAAGTLPEAWEAARSSGAERLVFNGAWIEELHEMKRCPAEGPELVLWAQNSPGFEWQCAAQGLRQSFRLVAVSDSQCYGFGGHPIYRRTVSIPNPAPDESLWCAPKSDGAPRLHITYVGALKVGKGFHHLAKVWPRFRAQHPQIDLMVCGSSSLYDPTAVCGAAGLTEDDYEQEILGHLGGSLEAAKSLGVTFRGSLPKRELREVVRTSLFAVVNPNLTGSTETYCCAAVEAQCFGVPVIGAGVDALRETIGNKVGGLLFYRQEDLLPAMLRLTGDSKLRGTLAKRGYLHVTAAYHRARIKARWLDFFEGRPLPRFAGDIREWVTLSDHARHLQRLIPLSAGRALRRLKARLRAERVGSNP
jgi:glycosyltransferase involved in cell wall biosynthesis